MTRARLSQGSKLWLASGSPRRREILESLGAPIFVRSAAADESVRGGEAPRAYLERVVAAKLDAAFASLATSSLAEPCGVVLVADTSVVLGARILGKPDDVVDAERMIGELAGRTHVVMTRFAIADVTERATLHAETVETRVTFRALTDERVRAYAATGEGLDKAGAYAVQGRGAALVARVEGSYSNVVGLPACEVAVALEGLGLLP